MSDTKKKCFVIMPFSKTSRKYTEDYWTKHFSDFLKPLIEEDSQFIAHRSEPLRGDILKQIITDLITSPLVVADLTELNPNVFWELGVRQSFKHGTITIAQKGTKLPFDINSKSTLFYYDNHEGNEEFSGNFRKAIASCSISMSPDSNVLDTISGRGTFYEIVHKEETRRRIDALIEEMNFNIGNIELLFKCVEDRKSLATVRFRTPSAELLLTHRYLDDASSLYSELQIIYTNNLILNNLLALHQNNLDMVVTFFGGTAEWKGLLTKYVKEKTIEQIKALENIRDKLTETY